MKSKRMLALLCTFALLTSLFVPYSNIGSANETASDVLTVAEAIAQYEDGETGPAKVRGYIVGTTSTSQSLGTGVFEAPFTVRTNVLIADSPDERDMSNIMPIQLPPNSIRDAVTVVDNPENLGKEIVFTGTMSAYFGVAGLRNVTEFEFMADPTEPAPIDDPDRDYLTVREAIDNNSGTETVQGYIVGTRNQFDGPFTVRTNIQIADHPDERGLVNTLPVQLPIGSIREALNLVDNPENLGKKIRITGDLSPYFSVPGLRTPSSFEFVDGDPGELPIPTVSISEARNMQGQLVTTTGVVNIDNGLLQPGRLSVYIQDGDAGIQLFNFSIHQFPTIEKGDLVEVTGRVDEHNGVKQLFVEELTVVAKDQEIVVKDVSISDYLDAQVADSLEGQLVTMEGYIYNIPDFSSGGVNIVLVDEDLNVLTLRLWESTGIDREALETNQWYQITAISSQFRGTPQILPRYQDDFERLDPQREKPFTKGLEIVTTVERVVDGDTVRLSSPIFGTTNVRYLNMDTPETYHRVQSELDQNQMDHGNRATEYLQSIIADGDEIIVRLGDEPLDGFGRLLAEIIHKDSGINTNLEMVRAGYAVTYFIWPFEDEIVEEYILAQKEAMQNKAGIWDPSDPLLEMPFEFRARESGRELHRPVGHFRTKYYVQAHDWQLISPAYRVFFPTEDLALNLGYKPLPETKVEVVQDMKAVVTELYEADDINRVNTYRALSNQVDTIHRNLLQHKKAVEKGNDRAALAHQQNYLISVEKLKRDLERELRNGHLSEAAYEMMLAYIETLEVIEFQQPAAYSYSVAI